MTRYLPVKALRLSLGLFFIMLGILGISPKHGESVFAIVTKYSNLEMIFGIVEFICGLLLIMGLFTLMRRSTVKLASFVVLIFWVARIIFSKFIFGMVVKNSIYFKDGLATWLLVLFCELVIAAAIYVVYVVYE